MVWNPAIKKQKTVLRLWNIPLTGHYLLLTLEQDFAGERLVSLPPLLYPKGDAERNTIFFETDLALFHQVLRLADRSDLSLQPRNWSEREFTFRIAASATQAYMNLLGRGLIEDPPILVISGVSVAVAGLVPNFTTKTKEGRVVSRKVKAAFWRYEHSESRGVVTETIEFRLMKLIDAFRAAYMAFTGSLKEGPSPRCQMKALSICGMGS